MVWTWYQGTVGYTRVRGWRSFPFL